MVGPAMTTFKANKILTEPLFSSNVLIWSGLVIFQFPLDFLVRCFFMFTRISIVDAQLDLGLLLA